MQSMEFFEGIIQMDKAAMLKRRKKEKDTQERRKISDVANST